MSEVLICGGVYGTTPSGSVYLYNWKTNSFEKQENMICKRQWAGIHFYNESVYVMGGVDDRGIATANFEAFSMITRHWKPLAILPLPISH
jgi:hypothetical protein